ncbi:ABC transporter ATP-binding protein [Methylobacterium isbiliense]|uniref:Glycine betaine/carnitine/choline transport ATP-binding protein OpuCA n=1 Tax=Methylobacterium isbiliense TaxID=315478 RepID=A0ABQ4S5G0_9HYPH|nr:ABC transporter ATP-binding protein [Methylobacterium isbiliense]MDN3622819.1 ABC transporter ATP-binding protein [Methylobacterium isbiliense]GJD98376.1 Glycine betaine/carnitine/choline transport ATP-binding protein OpuCA [Methylobacterium isbiliense]
MLRVEHLSKSFGGVRATRDVSIDFPDGSLTAIIGPNGAGKTTFFNLISGHVRPDEGRVLFDGTDIVGLSSLKVVRRGMARAFQVASLFPSLTVREALTAAVISHQHRSWRVLARFPSRDAQARADEIMDLLGLGPKAQVLSANLSHGDQKLLDIGLALAMDPKVLLLDEPTAGMGTEERWRMIGKVQALWEARKMTVVFIEHDMDIVFRIAQTIHVLKYGAVLAQGTPDEIRRNRDVIDAYLGTDHGLSETVGEA